MSNYILAYYQAIQDGSIVVGRWIRTWYEYIVKGIEAGEFEFNLKKANKAIKFIENFCHHCSHCCLVLYFLLHYKNCFEVKKRLLHDNKNSWWFQKNFKAAAGY